ncbi:MAG: IS630-like element ISMae26 family transposase [Microcystis sp. M53603_WE2]|uniref:IS630-like element ISMae26 family transposase n=1 Tax=Microcystis TaxID=1125 RepID=UPI0009734F3B|nr:MULTISPECIES: IS630-like element ISMae26 family transposase [Microcystis]MDJ0541378.1 IS630-like element ISMae26 family transposase [Microcystis sp. M53603_WE2]MDJ0606843.1 IS630-like element ISMae26 family transposase [Microcystis sp. M53602_WE12]NCR02397.1 IS630-like element ISMae26 family transposase [Microcystis aeruginosa L211-11]NCR33968.1 IS630-like element ISMae26 family transposase [Microcystis aeruginosa L211-101]
MRPYSVDFRQKIIDVWKKEKISIRGLAQRFDVAKSFIQKLLKQHKETGDIRPRPQGGSPPTKLNSEQLIILIEIIEANNDATLEELSDLLYEKTQVKVSRATLGRLTQKLNYSFKKKTLHAAEKESDRVQQKRVEYWSEVREIEASKLIFIDESGVNLALLRLYARALIGRRARGRKPQKRGRNISIISAISLEKVVASVNIYGAVDAVTFEGFILKEVLPKIKEGDCLIMDNAKIHLGEMVREIIEQEKARLIYLPPYSPEFSPIENFWSKVKATLRKLKARTYKDLIEGIELAMLEVTQKDIRNWFTHCCYCTS